MSIRMASAGCGCWTGVPGGMCAKHGVEMERATPVGRFVLYEEYLKRCYEVRVREIEELEEMAK